MSIPGAERRAGEAIAAVRTHPVDLDGASFRHFAATREVRGGMHIWYACTCIYVCRMYTCISSFGASIGRRLEAATLLDSSCTRGLLEGY